MYKQFGGSGFTDAVDRAIPQIAPSGELDTLVALERIGTRRSFARNDEIYAECDPSDSWYKVVAGTVRICKLLADGRRHIADFCFAGDCFGLDVSAERTFSAEAVSDAVVMRYPRGATERLLDDSPQLARQLRDMTLRELAHAQTLTLRLGQMTAPERVANFLLELADRRDGQRVLDLPMSRNDIADYIGLTIETVCRVLSAFKRNGIIAISNPQRIELSNRDALELICEA